MTIETVLQNTSIVDYSPAQTLFLETALRTMYADSAAGRAMLDKVTAANPLEIKFVEGKALAYRGAGKVELDFSVINGLAFFDETGKAVQVTVDHVLRHELVHAIENIGDTPRGITSTVDSKGPTVAFEATINTQMSLPNRLSYEGVDSITRLIPGTDYTGGAAIDLALARQGYVDTSANNQATNDLLWGRGDDTREHFISGAGNDFLYGNGGGDILNGGAGNDSINGGAGTDVAVFSGKCSDYTRVPNVNGTLTVTDTRPGSPDGVDILRDVEYARFSDGYMNLTTGEFACPGQNVVIIIDKTGSMSDDIVATKAAALAIANSLFGTETHPVASTLAIVTYWDSNTVTNLAFTKQDLVADRRAAALAALNGLSESTSGGTENLNTAILYAMNGHAGTWDPRNTANKIIVFTDEDADDPQLRAEVVARAVAGNFVLEGDPSAAATADVLPSDGSKSFIAYTDTPFSDMPTTRAVQILPVVIGSSTTANSDLQNLADQTDGQVFNVDSADPAGSAASLVAAIAARSGTDGPDMLTGDNGANAIAGLAGNDTINGLGGNDTLTGGPGDDLIYGGAGDDNLRGSSGNDTIDGGDGTDTVSVNALSSDVNVTGPVTALVIQSIDGDVTISNVEFLRFLNTTLSFASLDSLRDRIVFGTLGHDTLDGDASANTIWGRSGNDVIRGLDGNDTLRGDAGDDALYGGAGDDLLIAGPGADTLTGGDGSDTAQVQFNRAQVRVDGPDDRLVLTTPEGTVTLAEIEAVRFSDTTLTFAALLAARNEVLVGTDGADTLSGGFGDDSISGFAGDDLLLGGDGNDTLSSGAGRDTLYGGRGDDLLQMVRAIGVTVIPNTLENTLANPAPLPQAWSLDPSADVNNPTTVPHQSLQITGSGQTEEAFHFNGRAGETWIFDVDGASYDTRLTLYGSAGALIASNDDSSISNGAGGSTSSYDSYIEYQIPADGLFTIVLQRYSRGAMSGSDTATLNISSTGATPQSAVNQDGGVLYGEDGNDTLTGGAGNDRMDGGTGADHLDGGNGLDTLIGGDGDDFLFGGTSTSDLRDVMYGGDGNDSMDGGWGNDELHGGNGRDTISGGFGADTVIGNAGDDFLAGAAGSDLMFGGPGNDTLNGGFGYDRMNGGTGADRFFHLGVPDHASDWIQDYNAADGDVLVFGQLGATRSQFQINVNTTPTAGADDVAEAFVIYRPTGQIMWALVDGAGQSSINAQIGGQVFDLLA